MSFNLVNITHNTQVSVTNNLKKKIEKKDFSVNKFTTIIQTENNTKNIFKIWNES